jgi:hypothetical protein
MSRLDCVRETVRLALKELEEVVPLEGRPVFWVGLWERYVESQVDYRASSEVLGRKLGEAGGDAWQLLAWLRAPAQGQWAGGPQVQLLGRVFGEQFEVVAGRVSPSAQEKEPVVGDSQGPPEGVAEAQEAVGEAVPPGSAPPSSAAGAVAAGQTEFGAEAMGGTVQVQPKGKGELSSDRVQNPHEPEATYGVKGEGQRKKEHVGYKIQVAETVNEAVLAPGEPTGNFLTGIVTHRAHESDEAGAEKMEQEQARMGMEKPPVQYVDGAYVSAQKLAEAQAEGRELMGPAQPALRKEGRFSVEDFRIEVEAQRAVCPAGKVNTQCSRLEEKATGKVVYRFEFSTHCHDCPLREQCLGQDQRHRTLVVGEHHSALQARRREQQTAEFKQRMKHRNAIEGTQSELVRGHGLRRARYRGLAKVKLQNYFIGAACNVKRWIRRELWRLQRAAAATLAPQAAQAGN